MAQALRGCGRLWILISSLNALVAVSRAALCHKLTERSQSLRGEPVEIDGEDDASTIATGKADNVPPDVGGVALG